jgi:hypothetical protein
MHSTVSTRLYGRAHHPYATIRSNAPIIRYYTVECIYHICECTIKCTYYMILYGWMHLPYMQMYDWMHLLYDTILSNASTIHVNVWSNAPIIWYYMVECIYHICECKFECTYYTILYSRCTYHVCECIIECTYYMILYGWMHLPYMQMYDRMHL